MKYYGNDWRMFLIGSILLFFIGIVGGNILHLITDKNYYGWPAVTQCRICNKTVWAWQNHERRDYKVKSNSYMVVGASGIVHAECKGNPEFKINIEVK
jgi:hypothetical protein